MEKRLEVGKRYLFQMHDHADFKGEVRTLDYPSGYAGANADGKHPIWVTGTLFEHWLNPLEIVSATEIPR